MLTVGDRFPEFKRQAVLANKEFGEVSSEEYKMRVNVNNDATSRNVAEVLRALEATQTHELTACDWMP